MSLAPMTPTAACVGFGPISTTAYASTLSTGYTIPITANSSGAITVTGNVTATDYHFTAGGSLDSRLAKIEERLLILVPDPAKLEKFEALRNAYNDYKLLEMLCSEHK